MNVLLLAQATELADKGLSILERVQAGGVLLICLVVACICGAAFYWQLKRNNKFQSDALTEAKKRETDKETDAKGRLTEQETRLREVMERDREVSEAHQDATRALEGFNSTLQDQAQAIRDLSRLVETQSRQIADLEATVRRHHERGTGT